MGREEWAEEGDVSRWLHESQPAIILRRFALLCAVCTLPTLHGPLYGQPVLFEDVARGQYYKAKGIGLQVKWDVPRTTVEEGSELTAVLAIGSDRYPVLNPIEVVKPGSVEVAWRSRTGSPSPMCRDPPPKPDDKEIRFTYKLKPRNRTVSQIPELEFWYYNPRPLRRARSVPQRRPTPFRSPSQSRDRSLSRSFR